jgi:DNA polymerase-3 subunit delta
VAEDIKPAYLIAGDDGSKIAAALSRLRARAHREGGAAALESFDPPDGQGAPDAEAFIAALPAMSLLSTRRYLVVDHVERWTKKQTDAVAARLGDADSDTTVVLVSRERPPRALVDAVNKREGQILNYEAPRARNLPGWLVAEAKARGFELDREAARMLVDRMGEGTARLGVELDRLSLWAGPGGEVGHDDVSAMVADTSEEMIWNLSDALGARQVGAGLAAAERLGAQGESVSHLVYSLASRIRRAILALTQLEAGRPQKEVEGSLGMSPYAARMLLRSVRDSSPSELRAAACAVADLEWWTRGGSDYGDATALALAVRAAAGGG